MSAFICLLENFQAAILDGAPAKMTPALKANSRLSPEQQMTIYTEGYRLRLTSAVESDHPALIAYLGADVFRILARSYVEKNFSHHFNLDKYPHQFSKYSSSHSADRFAADLASLEGAIAEVFTAPESAELTPHYFETLTEEDLAGLILKPRAASRLAAFEYPVNEWLARQRDGELSPAPQPEKTFLYIYRHKNEVRREALSEAAFALLSLFFAGKPVAEALEIAAKQEPAYGPAIACELQTWFKHWISIGFFS